MNGREFVSKVFTPDDRNHLGSLVQEYKNKSNITVHDIEGLGQRLHQAGVPVSQSGAIEARARALGIR